MVPPSVEPASFDQRERTGPFDLIGDVHGCAGELDALLVELGYRSDGDGDGDGDGNGDVDGARRHPAGRTAVLLGDLIDRGPANLRVVRRVSDMVRAGSALYVPGNHDERLAAFLFGADAEVNHGLEQTVGELDGCDDDDRADAIERFLELYHRSAPYLWLDGGRLVAVHGGLEERMIGSFDPEIWRFCVMGKLVEDASWPPTLRRVDWARDYSGEPLVVYGHTPVPEARLVRNTINVDQGCVFGGALTAFRYPERALVSVPASRPYYLPGVSVAR